MNSRPIGSKLKIINDHIENSFLPIKVVPLAKALGINVYGADWPNDISGKIQKEVGRGGGSDFAIYVNKNHPQTRRRFTVAHEIAHYVLHEDEIGDGIFDDALYRSGLSDRIEVQANNLAADILMPERAVKQSYKKITDVADLAQKFNVSTQAMSIRLKDLVGLLT